MSWAPDYITLDEMKNYKKIPLDDDVDDDELELAITAASRAVDDHCNRQFGKVSAAEERFYTAWPDYSRGRWVIGIDDLMDDTGLATSIDGDVIDSYDLEPVNAAAKSRPWTRLAVGTDATVFPTGCSNEISVTAIWGWSTVPSPVKQATKLQASRFMSRRNSPYGVAGSPTDGSEIRLLQKLDPDVAVSLRSYVRPRATG